MLFSGDLRRQPYRTTLSAKQTGYALLFISSRWLNPLRDPRGTGRQDASSARRDHLRRDEPTEDHFITRPEQGLQSQPPFDSTSLGRAHNLQRNCERIKIKRPAHATCRVCLQMGQVIIRSTDKKWHNLWITRFLRDVRTYVV